ncbi:MAG: DUF3494 domain-containing protein [Trueperaceae bacterium]|nr:MAG: DUF3494 domain-containing protein [Trueperaceae bacterium]
MGAIALAAVLAACSAPGAVDTTPPTVVQTTPNEAGLAPTNVPATATFSEAIDASTLTQNSFTLTGPGVTPVAGSVDYDASTMMAVYTPTLALAIDTTYTATLSSDVTDLAGNALDGPVTWTFTTGTETSAIAAVNLRSAGDFVLLAKTGISAETGPTITGDVGISPAALSYVTGFNETLDASETFAASTLVDGKIYAANLAAPTPTMLTTAISDMETAYTDAAGRTMPNETELATGLIGGLDIAPGLYAWGTDVAINTNLTLTGSATDVWILQVAQDLTLANGIEVFLEGGALAENVYWQVAGKVTLGTTSVFHGTILGQTAVIMNTGASLNGRALAQTAITLIAATVTQ